MNIEDSNEIWVNAFRWDGLYEVSSHGRIRSLNRMSKCGIGKRLNNGQIITPIFHKTTKYNVVNFTGFGKRKQLLVHRLVLESFCGECPDGKEACHNNGNRKDNSLKNLRWDTRKNNHADKKIHGTWQGGENNPCSKLKDSDVKRIRNSKEKISDLMKDIGVSEGCIKKAKYGETWKHVL